MRRTAFDEFFDEQMESPAVADAYRHARDEIDSVDRFMRALEAARSSHGLSKAELAKRSQLPAETVRRLLTTERANPTIATVLSMLRPMGLGLRIVPVRKARRGRSRDSGRRVKRAS